MDMSKIGASTKKDVWLYNNLDEVGRTAGSQLDRSSQACMYDRLEWFELAAKYTLDGEPLIINAQQKNGQAWLFLDRDGPSAFALSNWYCLRYAPVTQGEVDDKLFESLVDGLLQANVTHVFIDPLGEKGPLASALSRKGWLVRFEQVNECWWIDTRGMDFEDYWSRRPSRLRNTAKRKAKKAKLDIRIFDRFCDRAWNDLEAVFDASWKEPEGSAGLIREIAQVEGAAGTLRVGLAYRDGVAVAAQIWTVENGSATIHKLAYREDAQKLSAGTILSVEMFRNALDKDQVKKIDFGIGNDSYKREWMSDCEPLYAMTAYYPYRWSGIMGLVKVAWRKSLQRLGLRKLKVSLRDQPRR